MFRAFSGSALARWALTAAVAAIAAAGLARMSFHIEPQVLVRACAVSVLLAGCALAFVLAAKRTGRAILAAVADLLFVLSQGWTFLIAAVGLQFVAASVNAPLVDAALQAADAAIGFDWYAFNSWYEKPGALADALTLAYASPYPQLLVLACAHGLRAKDDGLGELSWCYMLSLLAVIALSAVFPALAHPGLIGSQHLQVFLGAREGAVTQVSGIVSFPSFHAAMAVIFMYSARAFLPLLMAFVPLNLLLIAATPPCGGHYLVDTLAGIALALCAIAAVRWAPSLAARLRQSGPSWPLPEKLRPDSRSVASNLRSS